ncbi:MAG: zf-TFIIB domain-containing protein, partial [Phycisphaerales bacterium]|nr:zf-TFIIB domain-containing protein [Phycisphaerales bacterium]
WVQPDDPSIGSPPTCPRDNTPLTQVRDPKQPHVQYDLCPHCGGVFFDTGELADLTEFTLRERIGWLFPGRPG